MAAQPLQAVTLIGLGVRAMSLAPASIPLVKAAINSVDMSRLRPVVMNAMKLTSASEVEVMLTKELPTQAAELFAVRPTQ
jgi:phosphoenolpyruvate-protein kinase (PTS system EI component)